MRDCMYCCLLAARSETDCCNCFYYYYKTHTAYWLLLHADQDHIGPSLLLYHALGPWPLAPDLQYTTYVT